MTAESTRDDKKSVGNCWFEELRSFGACKRSALEVLEKLWNILPSLETPLGRMAKSLDHRGVPPDDKTRPERGNDLLPLNPNVVDSAVEVESKLKGPLKLLLHVLNYLSMGCRDNPKADLTIPEGLSQGQQLMVEHLTERLVDLGEEETPCPPVAEADVQLRRARFDYAGEPIQVMEPLEAAKVIPVWPRVGECAVKSVMDLVPI